MNPGARFLRSVKGSPTAVVATGIVALSYALAFAQRPGRTFADTRIELTTDPTRFLHSVTSLWSSTGDLGHVQSGQFVGYLVPMAPWYAFAHAVGLGTWVAERIWLGSLLAGAGLGVVVLMRELLPRRAPVAQTVAAVLFLANPYVVVVIGRTSLWLLAYAALPWLLFAVRRGVRHPRGWRWPAVVGLLLLLANGGANVALPFWVVLAVPGLLVYEVLVVRSVNWGEAGAFALRAAACSVITSLWWLVPALLQSRYGTNPLPFTEQPIGILATPSVSESLRLLGYWQVYFGGAAGPSVAAAGPYLFDPLVIIASFLVPLAAIAGFARVRRWSYAPFLVLLAGAAVIVMSVGFPPGSPLNHLFISAYYHSTLIQVLRTTWKAAPLVALPIACLAGVWAEALVRTVRATGGIRIWRVRVPASALVSLGAVPILWGLPLFDGTAIDASAAYGSIPSYWHAALRDATGATTTNQRIMILPGELFGAYRWGDVGDSSVAPFLTPRRLAIREIARFSDPRSSQLQASIDDLVQQDRLVPGQLEPLLQLLGVGAVLVPTDGHLAADGALDPVDVANALRYQPQFNAPVQRYGRWRSYTPMPGRDGPSVWLPDIRRYAQPSGGPGVVRVHPFANTTVLDGDGNGIAELAAEQMMDPNRALVYAGDVGRRTVTELVASGAQLVFSDSNRRRIVGSSTIPADVGPTLEPRDPIASDTPSYDLFPTRGASGETVAVYSGLRYLRTPGPHRALAIFPADRPYAAFDSRLDTGWLADSQSSPSNWYLDLGLSSPRPVASIRIYPLREPFGLTTQVAVSVNRRPERRVSLGPGWNTIPIDAAPLRRLRIRITGVAGVGSAGGISELEIPGLYPDDALRLPTDLAGMTRGLDLSHNRLTILLARETADFPNREETPAGVLQQRSTVYAADAERDIRRVVTVPVARSFTVAGWASVRSAAPDPLLDGFAGVPAGWRFSSSGRFEGVPINRASSAFDGDPNTAWVARFFAGRTYPWIQWSWPRTLTIRRMQLTPGSKQYEFPNLVVVTAPGAKPQSAFVAPNGSVVLKHPIRSRVLRLQVVGVRYPIGKAEFLRYLDAVAIDEIRVPGLHPPAPHRTGAFATRCGELSVSAGSSIVPARVYGSLAALDQGEPLRLSGCGPGRALSLTAGSNVVDVPVGRVMQPDHLVLDSPAPAPLPAPTTPRLRSAGSAGQGSVDGVRPGVSGPSWLVLGESYSSGWRAWCREASGHERALGGSTPIDGYANGWRIDSSCLSARMAFAPQSIADLAYIVSAIGATLLVAIALGLKLPESARRRLTAPAGIRRTRSRRPKPASVIRQPSRPPLDRPPIRLQLRTALAWGAGVGALTGFVFAVRFGVVAGLLTAGLLLDGISVRRLTAVAFIGAVAIPLLYVARPAHNYGGFSFYFAQHQLLAHWIGAGVVCALLAAALLRTRELRASGRQPGTRDRERVDGGEAVEQGTSARLGSHA
jgi:arabinofuranan 3-O-arabinosyltransferase